MDKMRFLIKSSGRKPLLVILASLLFLTTSAMSDVAPSQTSETDKGKVVRQVAQKWIEVGAEQYKRGYFKAAEQSFLRAQDYQEYLTADERGKLNSLLEKTHKGILEREHILETIQAAEALVKQGEPGKARAKLEEIKDNEFLTKTEQEQIANGLNKLGSQDGGEQKKEITELYNRSVELYKAGELEKAREGFVKVAASGSVTTLPGETAEDYLLKIDNILAQKAKPVAVATEAPPDELGTTIASITKELVDGKKAEPNEPNVVTEQQVGREPVTVVSGGEATEAAPSKDTYIEVINRKRNIRQSHTRAVVNDAVAKVQDYISKDEFDKAKEEVENAERIVNEYQADLGDELFKQNSDELKQLAEKIAQAQDQRAQQLQEQKRLEAVEAQRKDREQMEADRNKRIAELMDNAVTLQSQQRYEEALGQLESLLTLDPLNNQALLLKQTLTDTVGFRKQLEVQREADKERVNTLVETDKATIPYAKELTHPEDWRDIIASPFRQPEPPIGRSEADAAVYKQLDEIVDLSQLTPDTPFGEAIEVLKNSVDPPLKIFVNWRDLSDNADIDQTTPIHMDPISSIPLKKGLELLLQAVSGGVGNVSKAVKDGVLTIATSQSLPPAMEPLVYDITDLIGRPADFYSQVGGTVTAPAQGEAGTEQLGEQTEQITRQDLITQAAARANNLVQLIEQTIQPTSWVEAGGEGSITVYENKKLIIYQTREVHNQIEELLARLRQALGNQVSIEARFLVVGENFLEDIGLDIDRLRIPAGTFGGNTGLIDISGGSASLTLPTDTGISGSWGAVVNPPIGSTTTGTNALTTSFSIGNIALLNQLQVDILLRATQAHTDSKSLTAPKVTVLSGEMASFQVGRYRRYPANVTTDISTIGTPPNQTFYYTVNYEERSIVSGPLLNITPIITPDKKNVLLNIVTEIRDFLGMTTYNIQLPAVGSIAAGAYTIPLPDTEVSRVQTRVSVPDKATLLLGGQRLTAEEEKEAGVPVLSKVPFVGRLFSSRSKIKDSQILLILVKPTIILREEAEHNAIAAMEGSS